MSRATAKKLVMGNSLTLNDLFNVVTEITFFVESICFKVLNIKKENKIKRSQYFVTFYKYNLKEFKSQEKDILCTTKASL